MKTTTRINASILVLPILLLFFQTVAMAQLNSSELVGAWETGAKVKTTKIVTDQHFAVTTYNVDDKTFVSTAGGRWRTDGKNVIEIFEFHSANPEMVGKEISIPGELKGGQLLLTVDGKKEKWKKLDNGTPGKLAGAWLITGRNVDGQMQKITPGARRTMKILSGSRFQWIAYNTETKEFLGTGGGTYSTDNGKYTENILFFSRDNSRVGASLQFDFSLEDGDWRHKGLSSKGDPIDEVWSKREKIGL
jgi:hypothetical protein